MISELLKHNITVGSLIFRNDSYPCYIIGLIDGNNAVFIRNSYSNSLTYGVIKLDTLNDDLVGKSDKSKKFRISAIINNPSLNCITTSLNTQFDTVDDFLASHEEFNFDNINPYTDDRKYLTKGNLFLDRNGGAYPIIGIHQGSLHTINQNLDANVFPLSEYRPNLYGITSMRRGIKCIFTGSEAISLLFNSSTNRITNKDIDRSSIKSYKIYDNRTQKDLGLWKAK